MIVTNSVLLRKLEEIRKTNKQSYYKLRIWYEEIKDYEKLQFSDVKSLNKLMLESTGGEKDIIREKLILGSLYWIFNFVCDSGLTSISSSFFDVDDIMSISLEIWINMLDEGILVKDDYIVFHHYYGVIYNKVIYNIFEDDKSKDSIKILGDDSKSKRIEINFNSFAFL